MSQIIHKSFPGIVKVEYFDLMQLDSDRIDLDAMVGKFPSMPEKTFEIPLLGSGTGESSLSDGAETCSISFDSDRQIRPDFRPGFIITDADGCAWMIASSCKPFPICEIKRSFGKMPEERPKFQYTIKHSAVVTPVKVIS